MILLIVVPSSQKPASIDCASGAKHVQDLQLSYGPNFPGEGMEECEFIEDHPFAHHFQQEARPWPLGGSKDMPFFGEARLLPQDIPHSM